MHVNEIHLRHNRHHKVSSLMKFHQKTQNYIKYEVYEKDTKYSETRLVLISGHKCLLYKCDLITLRATPHLLGHI